MKPNKIVRNLRVELWPRSRLLLLSVGLAAASALTANADLSPQLPMPGKSVPRFVDALPDLVVLDGTKPVNLEMREFQAQVLPTGMPQTWVWGYQVPGQANSASYIGPVIVARRGTPTELKVINNLGSVGDTKIDAYRYGTDQTLHWADPVDEGMNMFNHMAMPPAFGSGGAQNYNGPIPAAVHLHGGEVPPQLDGGPDSWFTSNGILGAGYYSKDYSKDGSQTLASADTRNYMIYRYPNTQEAAPIWFHDHTLGATRLNVYCGLAGAYLVTDPANEPANLPPLIPLVIQDRMFDTGGQWFFPAATMGGVLWALNPEHPYWQPEFLGDSIVINGKAWPYKNVEPKRYSVLFLNGSNARTYEMSLIDPVSKNVGPAIWVIGTDGGYLDAPAKIDPAAAKGNSKLVIMPGERYTAIIDFAGYQAGVIGPNGVAYSGRWQIKNTAKSPYPAGATPTSPLDRLLEFRVVLPLAAADTSFNPATAASVRPTPMVRLVNPATGTLTANVQQRRQLTLNEIMGMPQNAIDPISGLMTAYPGGPLEILVNNTRWDGRQVTGVGPMMMTGDLMYSFQSRPDFIADSLGNDISEVPTEGETELWEIINLTADAHPIHLHLVQFQLVNRQNIDVNKYMADYAAAFPGGGYDPMTGAPYPAGVFIPGFGPPRNYYTGNPVALGGNIDINALNAKNKALYLQSVATPPLPQEAGWKDTVIVFPGQVTRLAVRWAPTSVPANTDPALATFPFNPNDGAGYVWHCHIIDHEDNEMMRPDAVVPRDGAIRTYTKGKDF